MYSRLYHMHALIAVDLNDMEFSAAHLNDAGFPAVDLNGIVFPAADLNYVASCSGSERYGFLRSG